MKRKSFSLLLLLFMLVRSTYAFTGIDQKLERVDFSLLENTSLFDYQSDNRLLDNYVKEYELCKINDHAIKHLLASSPHALKIPILIDGKWTTLHLVQNQNFLKNTLFTTQNEQGQTITPYSKGLYYHGRVDGAPLSVVAISIFADEVMGIIATDEGNWVVGKLQQQLKNMDLHVIYNDKSMLTPPDFACHSSEKSPLPKASEDEIIVESLATKCIKLYIECDFKVYQDFSNSVPNATNYATGLMNNVATLYLNDSVQIGISQINIWTSSDPYASANNTSAMLTAFATQMTNGFNGDVAHLLSRRSVGGGIAYLGILCINQNYYKTGLSANLSTTITPLPTYSWNSMVITHELGHNFGSPHSHACFWNGNNTRIDNCAGNFNVAYQEGNCNSFPPDPVGGGTIMSYCHLSNVGINLNLGFGPGPGNLIRSEVIAGNCLTPCIECNQDITISGNYATPSTESATWIQSVAATTISNSGTIALDADENEYILMAPANNNAFFISQPANNNAYFVAQAYNGCENSLPNKPTNTNGLVSSGTGSNLISCYPNPTRGELFFSHSHGIPISALTVYSSGGQLLLHESANTKSISMTSLSAGIYFVKVVCADVVEYLRVIKE